MHIQASPIKKEEGIWTVHFAVDDRPIGTVQVHPGYTESGWADDITEDVKVFCENHAVEQYQSEVEEALSQLLEECLDVVVVPEGLEVVSQDGTKIGHTTGKSHRCKLEGCLGTRITVKWQDGRITHPCTKAMEWDGQRWKLDSVTDGSIRPKANLDILG